MAYGQHSVPIVDRVIRRQIRNQPYLVLSLDSINVGLRGYVDDEALLEPQPVANMYLTSITLGEAQGADRSCEPFLSTV